MCSILRRSAPFPFPRLLLGILFSTIISLLAYRRRSLSRSGIAGAIVTGTTTFGLGGWSWGLSLIFFFVSSSLLSHFRASAKAQTTADKFSKGGQRDLAQVVANGGVAALLALAYGLTSSRFLQSLLRAGYAGALATATADTWATELGTLSSHAPRLITNGKPVAPGTSGGITLLGSGAGLLGALTTGMVFWGLERGVEGDRIRQAATRAYRYKGFGWNRNSRRSGGKRISRGMAGGHKGPYPADAPPPPLREDRSRLACQKPLPVRTTRASTPQPHHPYSHLTSLPPLALLGGLMGCLADSLLGATWQVMYYCPLCEKETERSVHSCGTRTLPLRGISWLNNDVVNFTATLCGALTAIALHMVAMKGKTLIDGK